MPEPRIVARHCHMRYSPWAGDIVAALLASHVIRPLQVEPPGLVGLLTTSPAREVGKRLRAIVVPALGLLEGLLGGSLGALVGDGVGDDVLVDDLSLENKPRKQSLRVKSLRVSSTIASATARASNQPSSWSGGDGIFHLSQNSTRTFRRTCAHALEPHLAEVGGVVGGGGVGGGEVSLQTDTAEGGLVGDC